MFLHVITCAGDGFAFDKLMSSSAASLAWLSEAVYSGYIESMLMIHWKDHMTRYFERIWAAWHEIGAERTWEISSIGKGNVYISGFHRDSCKRYRIAMPSRWKMIAVLIILIKGFKRTIPKSLKITNTWHLGECVNGDFSSFRDSTVFICFTIQDIGHFVASSFDLTFGLLDAVIQLGIYSDLAAKAWAAWMIFLLILRFNSRIESCSHCLHWLFVFKKQLSGPL